MDYHALENNIDDLTEEELNLLIREKYCSKYLGTTIALGVAAIATYAAYEGFKGSHMFLSYLKDHSENHFLDGLYSVSQFGLIGVAGVASFGLASFLMELKREYHNDSSVINRSRELLSEKYDAIDDIFSEQD